MKIWIAGKKIDFSGAKIKTLTLTIDGNTLRVYPLLAEAEFKFTPARRRSLRGEVKLTTIFGIAGIRRRGKDGGR